MTPEDNTLGAYFLPFGAITDPFVAYDGVTWRMWFTGMDYWVHVMGTLYSESADGFHWSTAHMAPSMPMRQMTHVLVPSHDWDGRGVETPTVLNHNGTWTMLYTGDVTPLNAMASHNSWNIGVATSPDGIQWTPGADPVLTPTLSWEGYCATNAGITPPDCCPAPSGTGCGPWVGGLLEPTVLLDDVTQRYLLWYSAGGLVGADFALRMGFATSADAIHWDKHPTPVFERGAAGSWDAVVAGHPHVVADPQHGYHLFYYGNGMTDEANAGIDPGSIGHAYSEDGITWERDPNNPVIARRPGMFDGEFLGGPSALFVNGVLRVYYFTSSTTVEANAGHYEMGVAQASCP